MSVRKIFTWETRVKRGIYPFHKTGYPYLVTLKHFLGQSISWFRKARHVSLLILPHSLYGFISDMPFPWVFSQRACLKNFLTKRTLRHINRHNQWLMIIYERPSMTLLTFGHWPCFLDMISFCYQRLKGNSRLILTIFYSNVNIGWINFTAIIYIDDE